MLRTELVKMNCSNTRKSQIPQPAACCQKIGSYRCADKPLDIGTHELLRTVDNFLTTMKVSLNEHKRIVAKDTEQLDNLAQQMRELMHLSTAQAEKIQRLEATISEHCRRLNEAECRHANERFQLDKGLFYERVKHLERHNQYLKQWLRLYKERFDADEQCEVIDCMRFYRRAAKIVKSIDSTSG